MLSDTVVRDGPSGCGRSEEKHISRIDEEKGLVSLVNRPWRWPKRSIGKCKPRPDEFDGFHSSSSSLGKIFRLKRSTETPHSLQECEDCREQ